MNIDTDKVFENAIRDAIREGVKAKLTGYNTPLDGMVKDALDANAAQFRKLLNEAIANSIDDGGFRADIKIAVRHSLAKTLVQRFGGEIEKQVNALKSDPTTRARITLAIEEIVSSTQPSGNPG